MIRACHLALLPLLGLAYAALAAGCFDWSSLSRACGVGQPAIYVVAGHTHTCARDSTGGASCWGDNRSGQLGNGTIVEADNPVAVAVPGGGAVERIYVARGDGQPTSTTASFSCLQTSDGALFCWGSNSSGQLGIGTTDQQTLPVEVNNLGPVTAACLGGEHACALDTGGLISCWGSAAQGQLGLEGATGIVMTPAAISPTAFSGTPTALACGFDYTCALVANTSSSRNDVYCWGDNQEGQLGTRADATASTTTPTPVLFDDGSPNPTNVAAGAAHTCVVFDDQSLACWGLNSDFQLGTGDTSSGPAQRMQPGSWANVSPGEVSTCALSTDGSISCWGSNVLGGVGDDTFGSLLGAPTKVKLTGAASGVWTGGLHTCAVVAGIAECWGDDAFGQLGDGAKQPRSLPQPAISACLSE